MRRLNKGRFNVMDIIEYEGSFYEVIMSFGIDFKLTKRDVKEMIQRLSDCGGIIKFKKRIL